MPRLPPRIIESDSDTEVSEPEARSPPRSPSRTVPESAARTRPTQKSSRSPGRSTTRTVSPSRKAQSPRRGHHYETTIKPGLSTQEAKYCSCVADVAAKQSDECLTSNRSKSGSGKCYNPYAVCAHSVGTTVRHCSPHYDYDAMDQEETRKLGLLKGKSLEQMKSERKK